MAGEASADLLAEFYAENSKAIPTCGVALILRGLPTDKRDALIQALAKPWKRNEYGSIQHMAISRTLKKWNQTLGPDAIGRHRMKACTCD